MKQRPLPLPIPRPQRGREVDRQPHPRHTRRRKDRLQGRHRRHEPPPSKRIPAGHRKDQGRVLPDQRSEQRRREVE